MPVAEPRLCVHRTPSNINWRCLCRLAENGALNTERQECYGPLCSWDQSCSPGVRVSEASPPERQTLPFSYSVYSTHLVLAAEFTGNNIWPEETGAKGQVLLIKPSHYGKGCFQSENSDL